MKNLTYLNAKRKVKKLRSFYMHLGIYLLVNAVIIVSGFMEGESATDPETYSMALFWGLGVVIHGLSVFVPNFVLGENWEQKKIKELMENEQNR